MSVVLLGYIIFAILVIVGLNLLLRRSNKKSLEKQERLSIDSKTIGAEHKPAHELVQRIEENDRHQENPDKIQDGRMVEETEKPQKRMERREKTRGKAPMTKVSEASLENIRKGPIIAVMILGAFVAILNQTLMNVALPQMMNDLNVSANTAQWLTTGYMLVNGVLIPISAFLMEKFTTRQLFIAAMTLFGVGTLICAIAPAFSFLLLGRIVQASGAGIIMPLMTNTFLTIFPVEKRGSAMGVIGLAMIFAPAVGPTLSGWVVENYSWRVLFYIVLPFAILDIILAFIMLRNVSRLTYPKLDYLAIVLSTIGFGGILYAFSEAGNKSWTSATVMVTLIVGLIALVLFIIRCYTAKVPMLEFRVFKYGMFSVAALVNAIITMAMFAGMILLPIYLQNIRGFTPLKSGLLLLPGAILMGIMSPITGWIFDKIGPKLLAVVGLAITTITTFQFAFLTDQTSYATLIILYSARMFGMSMIMMPIMTTGLNALPRRLNAHGTAMVNTLRQVAGSLGTAFLVSVMSNRTTFHTGNYANHMTTANDGFMSQFQSLGQHMAAMAGLPAEAGQTTAMQTLYGLVVKHATIQGINDAFIVATGLSVLALILSFFLKKSRPPQEDAPMPPEGHQEKISTKNQPMQSES